MRCGECGKKDLVKLNAKGKTFCHLDENKLELKYDLFLFTCLYCDNISLSSKDTKELSLLLDKSKETSQNDTEET